MRFFAGATLTVLLSTAVYAHPHPQDNAVIARSAEPEAIAEALVESANLLARSLDIDHTGAPKHKRVCPATNNAQWGNYPEHTYTPKQMKAAFLAGAGWDADSKQTGPGMYMVINTNPRPLTANIPQAITRTSSTVPNSSLTTAVPLPKSSLSYSTALSTRIPRLPTSPIVSCTS
jgi:hypothetical protein